MNKQVKLFSISLLIVNKWAEMGEMGLGRAIPTDS